MIRKLVGKLDNHINKVFKSFFIIGLLIVFIIGVSVILVITLPNKQVTYLLRELAQTNLTVAVGMGAISISIRNDKKVLAFLREIILLMLFSVLSFLLSFWNVLIVQRVYLFVCCLAMVLILLSVAKFIFDLSNEKKEEEEKPKQEKSIGNSAKHNKPSINKNKKKSKKKK